MTDENKTSLVLLIPRNARVPQPLGNSAGRIHTAPAQNQQPYGQQAYQQQAYQYLLPARRRKRAQSKSECQSGSQG